MKIENLPEVNFISTDTDTIRKNMFSVFESETGRTLSPADPERLFLEAQAVIIGQLRVEVNESAKQNLLAYAKESFLDHLGYLVDAERDGESYAKTTLRFSIVTPLSFAVAVDKGKRVSPDGKLFFAVDSSVEIAPGVTTVEVGSTCTSPGEIGNGYLEGQISKIVDTIPYINSVINITESSGGAEVESDDSFQEKINETPSTYSTAGPSESYKALAKSAHSDIIDVSIYTPSDARVGICVLMKGGDVPTQDILNLVSEYCSDKTKRPLTDKVDITAPEQVGYVPEVEYYLYKTDIDNAETVKRNIKKAYVDYISWQKSKLGRDIDPDAIIQALKNTGAKRVVVKKPGFVILSETQVAKEDEATTTQINQYLLDNSVDITSLVYMGALDE